MAVAFPSYLDALVEGFPPAFKATSFPPHEYIEDSENVREFLQKLFGRLSVLLFHIDKQINKVLMQGRLLPKKLNQWAMEARAMKCQVSNLLEEHKNRKGEALECEEWIEIGIKMINLLKRCPFKDEMMYDKPTPVVIQNPESSSEKPIRRLEEKYKVDETSHLYLKGNKMEHKTEKNSSSVISHDVRPEEDAGTSSSTPVEELGSEPVSDTEFAREEFSDKLGAVNSKIPSNSIFLSISEYKSGQSGNETTEEGISPEDNKTFESFGNLPMLVSGFDSEQRVESEFHGRVESEFHGEIQEVDEMTTMTYADEQRRTEPTSSNAERSNHEESIRDPISFEEKEHYSIFVDDNNLKLELDNQIILIGNYPSPAPLNSSPVNAMLNLVAQDMRELPEMPNYPNSLLLFLQRNKRLTLIHPSFFDCMPDLRFLDLSDTKIRILPSSLLKLSKLKVLLLRNCICLENLPPEIENLSNIEALDLLGTELYDLPKEIGQLTLLRSLQLSFYGPDDESEYEHLPPQLVSPSFLSELKEIEALSISMRPEDHRWKKIAARIVEDISKMEMLSYLQFYFPEVQMFEEFIKMSPSWEEQKVCKFDFIVGQNVKRIVSRVPDEVESLFNQQKRCLRYVNGDKASPWINTMLIRVTAFYLDHHTEVQSLSEFGITNFQALKFCIVRECPRILAILDEKNAESAFPCLEHLGIYFLWELKHIWKPSSPAGRLKRLLKTPNKLGENFKALRYLIINTCPKLQFILSESMLHCLTNLEELVVEDCERVEKIIKVENKKVKYEDNVLPGLRKLELHYLPELVSLGNGVHISKEKINYNGCPKLKLNS